MFNWFSLSQIFFCDSQMWESFNSLSLIPGDNLSPCQPIIGRYFFPQIALHLTFTIVEWNMQILIKVYSEIFLIHGFALAALAKQLMKSTCSKSMHPVVFRESEFTLCFWVAKYRILKKNTLLSVVFCLLCINEEQWFFMSKYFNSF